MIPQVKKIVRSIEDLTDELQFSSEEEETLEEVILLLKGIKGSEKAQQTNILANCKILEIQWSPRPLITYHFVSPSTGKPYSEKFTAYFPVSEKENLKSLRLKEGEVYDIETEKRGRQWIWLSAS